LAKEMIIKERNRITRETVIDEDQLIKIVPPIENNSFDGIQL